MGTPWIDLSDEEVERRKAELVARSTESAHWLCPACGGEKLVHADECALCSGLGHLEAAKAQEWLDRFDAALDAQGVHQ